MNSEEHGWNGPFNTQDVQRHRRTLYNALITEVLWDALAAKFKTYYTWCAFGKIFHSNLIDLIV